MNLTFADKFSRFKTRILIILWIICLVVFFIFSFSFFETLYSITKFQTRFFKIHIDLGKVQYEKVETPPADWTPLPKINRRLQEAIISSEDGTFYQHPGYDLEQLTKAINSSFVLKKKMRGASTITQQLIKNLYLNKEKVLSRKMSELFFSIMIEKYSDKKKILETYLNIIEYGKDIYGINKASHFYFNKSPSTLNARESAFIAMLLPSPIKYAKSFYKKSLTPFAKSSIDSILLKMRQAGYISEAEYNEQLQGRFHWEKPTIEDAESNELEISEEEVEPFDN